MQSIINRLVDLLPIVRSAVYFSAEGLSAIDQSDRPCALRRIANAAWVSVDDTRARHRAANGTCTQIGNDHFAWFGTTGSKSRLNYLELLRAGYHGLDADATELIDRH